MRQANMALYDVICSDAERAALYGWFKNHRKDGYGFKVPNLTLTLMLILTLPHP